MLKFSFTEKRQFQYWSLITEESVQDSFLKEVENLFGREEPFWDKESLTMMKLIDGAERDGDYTIVSPRGRGCIHSLTTECQLALMLIYTQRKARIARTVRLKMLSLQTLAWLNELEMDIEICLPPEIYREWILPEQYQMLEELAKEQTFMIEGEVAGPENDKWKADVKVIMREIEAQYKGMEPEEEGRAYKRHTDKKWTKMIFGEMKQQFTMTEFLNYFGLKAAEYDGFKIINTCPTFRSDDHVEPGMLFLIDERGIHQYPITQKSFGRTLINEILERYRDYNGTAMALVVDAGPDVYRTSDYPRHTEVGAKIDFDKKKITIYNKELAIRAFHQEYVNIFGEWVEEDD